MQKEQNDIFIKKLNDRRIEAYQRLYNEFYSSLVVYAFSFVTSDEAAEDIVQELFISIWEKNICFQSYQSFKTYLYRSVKNMALNFLKRQDVEERYVEYMKENSSDVDISEPELHQEEKYRLFFLAIDELPPRCREIFLLFLEGKQNKEVSEALNLSIDTVRTQKTRAIKFLRKRLTLALIKTITTITITLNNI